MHSTLTCKYLNPCSKATTLLQCRFLIATNMCNSAACRVHRYVVCTSMTCLHLQHKTATIAPGCTPFCVWSPSATTRQALCICHNRYKFSQVLPAEPTPVQLDPHGAGDKVWQQNLRLLHDAGLFCPAIHQHELLIRTQVVLQ